MSPKWRIWYDDGSTFDSEKGTPESAPLDGVLAVAEIRADGTVRPPRQGDYYLWTGDGWAVGKIQDLERWLRRELPQLKFGRWSRTDLFLETLERANREWRKNRGD